MFCPACGKSQSDDASFCEACGVRLLDRAEEIDPNVLTEVLPIEGDAGEADNEEQPDESAESEHSGLSFGKIVPIGVGILAVLAIAIAFIVYSIPPELSEEEIIAGFDQAALASNLSVADQWTEESDFAVSSIAVDSVEESKQQDQTYRIANVTVVSESASFRIVSAYRCIYLLQDRTWRLDDSFEMGQSIDPVGGVSNDAVIERMPTFIEQVDEKPYKDAKGNRHYLKTLYKENVTFSVLENNTAPSGGAVKVSMKTSSGLLSYSGVLTVNFAWNGSTWEVQDCSVDQTAYEADYSAFVGFWSGTRHDGNAAVGQDCLAGVTIPFKLTVKSVDASSQVMTVDMEFVIHQHEWLDNIVDSSEGDKTEVLNDVLIPIPETGRRTTAYESERDLKNQSEYRVFMEVSDDGTLEVSASSVWKFNTHYDFYTLTKQD